MIRDYSGADQFQERMANSQQQLDRSFDEMKQFGQDNIDQGRRFRDGLVEVTAISLLGNMLQKVLEGRNQH